MPVAYEREGDVLLWRQGIVTYHAKDVRRSSRGEGNKAWVTISEDGRILDEDDIGLGRREDRNRLANSAHKALNGAGTMYPADQLQHDLMLFTRDLWTEWNRASGAVWTTGDVEPSAPSFLVDDYVLADAGTILFGPPGAGKSWMGLLWAVCVNLGLSHIWPVHRTQVLYINLERSEASFRRRLGQVNESLGIPRDTPLLMMHERGKSLADIFDAAKATVEREGVGLVIIDSLSRSGVGSMVKDDSANRSMDLANGLGCAWVMLGHTNRQGDEHVYGSQMFDAAADLCVELRSEKPKDGDAARGAAPRLGIGLLVTKANDTGTPPLRIWTYEFDRQYGLTGVVEARRGEWPEIEGDDALGSSPQDQIRRLLLTEGELFTAQIAEGIGKDASNVSTYLRDMERRGIVVKRTEGVRNYYHIPAVGWDS